jgi:hypothetical protein
MVGWNGSIVWVSFMGSSFRIDAKLRPGA